MLALGRLGLVIVMVLGFVGKVEVSRADRDGTTHIEFNNAKSVHGLEKTDFPVLMADKSKKHTGLLALPHEVILRGLPETLVTTSWIRLMLERGDVSHDVWAIKFIGPKKDVLLTCSTSSRLLRANPSWMVACLQGRNIPFGPIFEHMATRKLRRA